jgi:hypothetical protein
MRVVDGWFLNCIELPFARSVGLPNEMRGVNQNDILRMLEKVADRFDRQQDLDVQPIPPVRDSDSPRSHGGRSIAFDGKRFPYTAKFCRDVAEDAHEFVARLERLANRAATPTVRYPWQCLRLFVDTLPRGAKVKDLDVPVVESVLETLVQGQIRG